MNLELLDPFGRQVPDRVDATIQLPDILHYPPSTQQQHQQQPLLNPLHQSSTDMKTTTTSKKAKKSKQKLKYDEEEDEEEDEEQEDDDEDEDDEIDDEDDMEESTTGTGTSRVKRRSNSKKAQTRNSKNRRRTSSEKNNASNISTTGSTGIKSSNMNTGSDYNDKKNVNDNDEWKAAYHVSYNRRGNYLAVGYGSGTVAVFCTLTRTLTALYYADSTDIDNNNNNYNSTTTSSHPPSDIHTAKLKSSTGNSHSNSKKHNKAMTAVSQSSSKNITTGCSSLSWARRSRRLLIGNYNDSRVKLYDTTHPIGAEDCACAAATIVSYGQTAAAAAAAAASSLSNNANNDPDDADNDSMTGDVKDIRSKASKEYIKSTSSPTVPISSSSLPNEIIPPVYPYGKTMPTPFADNDDDQKYTFVRKALSLPTQIVQPGDDSSPTATTTNAERDDDDNYYTKASITSQKSKHTTPNTLIRYPCVSFTFEHPVVGSLHIHPRYPNFGIAVLSDGSLVLFCTPFHSSIPFVNIPNVNHHDVGHGHANENEIDDDGTTNHSPVKIFHVYTENNVSCASFDSLGNRIYAVTKSGTILGFDVTQLWTVLVRECHRNDDGKTPHSILPLEPTIVIPRNFGGKGGDTASSSMTAVWHLIVSRNGKFLIVNSSDGTIRLYNTQECWNPTITMTDDPKSTGTNPIIKPTWIFQDVVTKVKFASCDLSGDGEYVVGGANGADNKYELHIWNTSTGALMDKLTGASTKLYSVAWHPTRSFLAVACSDGLVDVWGPRINWTAFAPDFQALPMNVEYIEREDEFDVDENGRHLAEGYYAPNELSESINSTTTPINVTKVERVPVFASDSEEEEEVFEYEIRVKNLLASRVVEAKSRY